jgi:hypothetical protein
VIGHRQSEPERTCTAQRRVKTLTSMLPVMLSSAPVSTDIKSTSTAGTERKSLSADLRSSAELSPHITRQLWAPR